MGLWTTIKSITAQAHHSRNRWSTRLCFLLSAGALLLSPAAASVDVTKVVVTGQAFSFSITADGTAPFTYQWRKDGVIIPSATGQTFGLSSVVSADAGAYSVIVANSVGSATSGDGVLIVSATAITAPTISDIANRAINEDGNTGAVSFTVGDAQTAAGSLTVSGSSSNTTLVPNASLVFGGTGANRTVAVTPAANQHGTATITVMVSDGTLTATDTFLLTVNPVNDAPTISDITNRTINASTNTGAVSFTVGDAETAAGSLTASQSSSNVTLVPNAAIVLGGSGANRTVTVTPAANQSGTATISVTVSDGTLTATDTFVLTVNAANTAPTISDIASRTISEDASTGAVSFTVGDAQTAAGSLTLSGSSSNTTLVPNTAIVFGGNGANRTVTITPAANQSGAATISVTVSDGTLTSSDTFVLTVNAVNDAPTISDITNRTIKVYANTGALSFTVGDLETAVGSLTVSGSSSNTTLVPNAAIVFGGAGANRTVTVTPAANQSGTATIGVTVSDGTFTTTDTFVLTVQLMAGGRLLAFVSHTYVSPAAPLASGFVIAGASPKSVLLRGVGPALNGSGVLNPLAAPRLRLFNAAGQMLLDAGAWGGSSALMQTFARVGAFPLASNSADAAVVVSLAPGAYTAQVVDVSGAGGVALAEVYDATDGEVVGDPRLAAVSARGNVDSTKYPFSGSLYLGGTAPKRLLIRGIGPELAKTGTAGALSNPLLIVYSSSYQVLAFNDDWQKPATFDVGHLAADGATIAAAAASVGLSALSNGSLDSAVIVTLAPGVYNVTVVAADGSIGIGQVDIYELP